MEPPLSWKSLRPASARLAMVKHATTRIFTAISSVSSPSAISRFTGMSSPRFLASAWASTSFPYAVPSCSYRAWRLTLNVYGNREFLKRLSFEIANSFDPLTSLYMPRMSVLHDRGQRINRRQRTFGSVTEAHAISSAPKTMEGTWQSKFGWPVGRWRW